MSIEPVSFLLDQNIAPELATWLRRQHPCWEFQHVSEVELSGATDSAIFLYAQREGHIVITFDEDFADARMFALGPHQGIIRLRVWPTTVEMTKKALARVFRTVPTADLRGALLIVDNHNIRVRRAKF